MSNRFANKIIIDTQNDGCSQTEYAALLDIFEYKMGKAALIDLVKGSFDLADCRLAKNKQLDGFSLTLERKIFDGAYFWDGVFECGNKRLRVMGQIEYDRENGTML